MRTARQITAGLGIAFALALTWSTQAQEVDPVQQQLAQSSCAALQSSAAAIPGDGPMLLPSYPSLPQGSGSLPALQNVAFVYDNALAGIALSACGQPAQSKRIADALLIAASHDPGFKDGRLRNAYRAGAASDKVELPGYWDKQGNFWNQDAYQVGTATGNSAWAALLLLTVYDRSKDRRYLDGAVAQLRWIASHTLGAAGPAGYEGGVYGYDNAQVAQHWKSTEQNIDVYAAATWAASYTHDAALTHQAEVAGGFVKAMWDSDQQRFFIGTLDDGKTLSRDKSGLDAQAWPLLAFRPLPAGWPAALHWIDAQHRSGAGYGYRRNPDGVWTEGTAQVAASMQAVGKPVPDTLWQLLAAQRSADGLLYATPQPRIGTDLAIGPSSTYADFFYYHLPHLGATAWAALAASRWNPFDGHPIDTKGSTP
jgi:hypothetical protein